MSVAYFLVYVLTALATTGTYQTKGIAKADIFPEKGIGDLSGYYICEGQEGPDKSYKGIAVISKKGDVYLVQWIIGTGINFHGVGIRNDTTLAASWAMPMGEKGTLVRGVNMYRIEPGPRLVGRWATVPTDGAVRSETLTFLKKIEDD
jgi:hypothetical protein